MEPGRVISNPEPQALSAFAGRVSRSKAAINIVFIAEGYLDSERDQFIEDIDQIVSDMNEFSPLRNYSNGRLAYWFYFEESPNSGPSRSAASDSHETLLGATVDSNNDAGLDLDAFERLTDSLFFVQPEYTLSSFMIGSGRGIFRTAITVVLLPAVSTPATSLYRAGEITAQYPQNGNGSDVSRDLVIMENGPGAHTVIAQEIGFHSGLRYEGVYDDPTFVTPTQEQAYSVIGPNLLFADPTNSPYIPYSKIWEPLTKDPDVAVINLPKIPNTNPQSPATTPLAMSMKIENLWEGGGGYQYQIYRSAEDCIMRRSVKHVTLPLRVEGLEFCPACRKALGGT